MRFRPGDLKHPSFFYLYQTSDYDKQGNRLVLFSIREELGEEILQIVFRQSSPLSEPHSPKAVFPLYAWGYHPQAVMMRRLFNGVYPGPHIRELRRLLVALNKGHIPRYCWDGHLKQFIPWRFRACSREFCEAQRLILFGALKRA
jgi:hypothetical protein